MVKCSGKCLRAMTRSRYCCARVNTEKGEGEERKQNIARGCGWAHLWSYWFHRGRGGHAGGTFFIVMGGASMEQAQQRESRSRGYFVNHMQKQKGTCQSREEARELGGAAHTRCVVFVEAHSHGSTRG